ncbi:RDD family protein [Snodgrassella gandavensis]|uniref:RDD family protein n=1 Tax=Snodgrassella gandavensis TaxID=2946698 RepID=UPI001EF465EB|nr:RDD family protein [Snodgrassella gandavensis]
MQKQDRIKTSTSDSDQYIQSIPALADGRLELATPAYRLCAITINQLFQYIIFLPISIYSLSALFNAMGEEDNSFDAMEEEYDSDELTQFFLDWLTLPQTLTIICLTITALIIFTAWQINWMSKYGQSIGKRMLNLRVIRTNGDNPGFVRNVILREIVYQLIVVIIGSLTLGIGYFVFMFVPAMVFINKWQRRTLPDFLADTIVVRDKFSEKPIKVKIPRR